MQFTTVVIALAAMAGVVSAQATVTVNACSPASTSTFSTAASSGVAASTIASTGVVTAPTSTGSPIAYVTGAASINGVSGLAAMIAGGVALFL